MSKIKNVEDLFIEFYEIVQKHNFQLPYFDQTAAYSFYINLLSDKSMTKNQAGYIIKLLNKYKRYLEIEGHDLPSLLQSLSWKRDFRIIDHGKKISIEQDAESVLWLCLHFPFSLKATFDIEFSDIIGNHWDHDKKIRKIPLYSVNFLKIEQFVEKHEFEIDMSFLDYKDQIDDIWQNKEFYEPHSVIVDNTVTIKNANVESLEFWQTQHTGKVGNDLLTAREMGYLLKADRLDSVVEKIAASSKNLFWSKDIKEFFSLYKSVDSKVCVILDRSADYFDWLKKFVNTADLQGIKRSEIKVCFREDGKPNSQVNQWIRDNSVGGKISDGRIFIFLNSPAKWLYKDLESFKIIITNGLFPFTSKTLQSLLSHHSCVINISEDKPSKQREIEIEEL